jgi:hypothetical protein
VARLQVRHQSGLRRFPPQQLARDSARGGRVAREERSHRTEVREGIGAVLFFGAEKLEAFVAEGVLAAPPGTPALAAVATALAAVARRSDEDSAFADFARRRHALIRAYAELRERELSKLASLASAMAAALLRRGVAEPTASLAAEAGVAAFKVGFERWVDDPRGRKMGHHVREAMRGFGRLVLEQVATFGTAKRAFVARSGARMLRPPRLA